MYFYQPQGIINLCKSQKKHHFSVIASIPFLVIASEAKQSQPYAKRNRLLRHFVPRNDGWSVIATAFLVIASEARQSIPDADSRRNRLLRFAPCS